MGCCATKKKDSAGEDKANPSEKQDRVVKTIIRSESTSTKKKMGIKY
jgi:hypothetical protein